MRDKKKELQELKFIVFLTEEEEGKEGEIKEGRLQSPPPPTPRPFLSWVRFFLNIKLQQGGEGAKLIHT